MTTPAPPQQQQQPPPAAPPPATIPPATLAAMALPLAGLLLTAASAAVVVAALKLRFKLGVLSALFWLAMLMVLSRIVMAHPPVLTGFAGPAGAQVSRMNAARRAQFALASASRVTTAMLTARAHGEPVTGAGRQQAEREQRYYAQHLAAMWNRARAAGQTDMAAAEHGPLLGWNTVLDSRTSAECKAADEWNYYASSMPYIGFPGAVHPGCRCYPSAPHPGGRLLPGSHPPRFARAA